MSRVLIVDDEIYAIDGLKDGIDWRALGVTQLFTANNAFDARRIYLHEWIDVMICDIEMPDESGMDLLRWVKQHRPNTDALFLTCHDDFRYVQEALRLGCVDYVLKPVPYDEMETTLRSVIKRRVETGIAVGTTTGHFQASSGSTLRYPVMAVWLMLLLDGHADLVESEVTDFLATLGSGKTLPEDEVYSFRDDMVQMVRDALKSRGITNPSFLDDDAALQAGTVRSVDSVTDWAVGLVKRAADAIERVEKASSTLGRAVEYIHRHITENMSCEKVADHMQLNPDYLSRVLKKGTGLNLSDYIISAKMNVARQLLAKTQMPVSRIASHVGYTNFSHFASIFRKANGMSPRQFRQKYS